MSDRRAGVHRRAVLSGVVGTAATIAGCSSSSGDRPISVMAAGSLSNALETGFRPALDATVRIEAHGSAQIARLVAEGQKDPDIVSLADVELFESIMEADWYAEFATNAVVLAYNDETAAGQRIADAGTDGWYRPLLDGDVRLGRTDPEQDPLGYRSLFVLDLASDHYNTDTDLRTAIPTRDQIYPETQLISQFESGSIDAALAYRNMAVERDYGFVDLPSAIDLSDPQYSEQYRLATYELPGGQVVRGGPISYGSTVRTDTDRVFDVFSTHVSGDYLSASGVTVPDDYPRYTGNVPDQLTN